MRTLLTAAATLALAAPAQAGYIPYGAFAQFQLNEYLVTDENRLWLQSPNGYIEVDYGDSPPLDCRFCGIGKFRRGDSPQVDGLLDDLTDGELTQYTLGWGSLPLTINEQSFDGGGNFDADPDFHWIDSLEGVDFGFRLAGGDYDAPEQSAALIRITPRGYPVPEPGALGLLGAACALPWRRRRTA